jgi:hypothetical protein
MVPVSLPPPGHHHQHVPVIAERAGKGLGTISRSMLHKKYELMTGSLPFWIMLFELAGLTLARSV